MRILQVIYELNPGGAERFIVDLSNELAILGEEVFLCVLLSEKERRNTSFNKDFLNNNVHYLNLETRTGFKLSTFTSVHKLLNKVKPNVVHFHLNVIPYFFFEALFRRKIRMFHTLHNIAEATVGGYQKPLNKYFYKRNIIVPITISKQCDLSFKSFYKLKNSICINNGRSEILPSEKIEIVRREIDSYKVNHDDFIFIHIASCSKAKNQELLIKAFNQLVEEKLHVLLLIIGKGYNDQEGTKLKQFACSKIKFLDIKRNVTDYLLNSNAFCLTSLYEGLPISLLEAIACGCVPICTPVGGIPDVIEEGETGYLSEDISISSYVLALKRFIIKPQNISKQSLIEYFRLNYSIASCAQKYLSVFNGL